MCRGPLLAAIRFHDRLAVVKGNRKLLTLMAAGTKLGPAAPRECGDQRLSLRRNPVARANEFLLNIFGAPERVSVSMFLAQLAPATTLVCEDVSNVDGG